MANHSSLETILILYNYIFFLLITYCLKYKVARNPTITINPMTITLNKIILDDSLSSKFSNNTILAFENCIK